MRNVRPTRRPPAPRAPDFRILIYGLVFTAICALAAAFAPARAQDASAPHGAGVVTMFSGWAWGSSPENAAIDLEGDSVRLYDLANPGEPASGARMDDIAAILGVPAAKVGQVFGIAVDNKEPANIYVAATSAYGLLRTADGTSWADGMWGEGGGPGTIYKLNAENGYEPEIFVTVTLDGRENSGAGLGNIAFDPINNQLFVSDLESGMIYAIDADTGEVFDRYDHGIEGRSYFLDTATAEYIVDDVVEFDGATSADLTECGDGPAEEVAARFAADPSCWNLADFRRRVYGLAVETNPETRTSRLYYAVWGAATFGNPDAEDAADDAVNSIWSVGLDENGGFDLQAIRREIVMPEFFVSLQDTEQFGGSHPVTDIAISENGVMFVAERGGITGLAAPDDLSPTAPSGARVIAFARDENANWAPQGRYDVGYYDRSELDPPYLRANAAGGIALGYGYTAEGALDADAAGATLWMTGDDLCSALGPCTVDDARPTTGIQGTPVAASTELAPAAAYTPYPDTGEPATPPGGPDASYMVPTPQGDGELAPGQIGDIEILRGGGAAPAADIDIAVQKAASGLCAPDETCYFDVEVQNLSDGLYEGPVLLADEIDAGLVLDGPDQGGFACYQAGARLTCYRPGVTLAPGERLSLQMAFRVPGTIGVDQVRNCVTVTWPGAGGRDQIRAVQIELSARGFETGEPDGIVGPKTMSAIAEVEAQAGLPETGEISDDLLVLLFGPHGTRAGDANGRNNRACAVAEIDVPPPPAHYAQISAFHRRFVSSAHDPRTSGPIELHDPVISSFHLKYKSSMHDGVTTKPVPWHKKTLSNFHKVGPSSAHNPKTTNAWPVHIPVISAFHKTWKSALHNPVTSLQFPVHQPVLSVFHKITKSALHNPKTTKAFPLHKVTLSNFHKTKKSSLHNPKTTKQFPLHNLAVSGFHKVSKSVVHNPATTKAFPLHKVTVSNFHKTKKSSLHNSKTTKTITLHNKLLSTFHKTAKSALHKATTSKTITLHQVTVSNFHKTNKSSQHNKKTSKAFPIHSTVLSAFHQKTKSTLHNAATTKLIQLHKVTLSNFHKSAKSSQHNAATSKAKVIVVPQPLHKTAISNFHKTAKSSLHNAATSKSKVVVQPQPLHKTAVSNFHKTAKSSLHNAATSGARIVIQPRPLHLKSVSDFHKTAQSSQHNPATSKSKVVVVPRPQIQPRVQPNVRPQPAHQTSLSNFHSKAPSSQHIPATSGQKLVIPQPRPGFRIQSN